MNQNDEFKNVINMNKNYNKKSFGKNFAVPFLSGALGCALVIRNMFWSSKYKIQTYWWNKKL